MSLRGHLLCTLFFPEPTEVIERIKRKHPGLRVTYQKVEAGVNVSPLPSAIYKDVTILCTLFNFPSPIDAPDLQLVHVASAGTDHVENLPIYRESSVPITTASGIHGPIISEWVIMTMLASSHRYPVLHELQKNKIWELSPAGRGKMGRVTDCVGKRLGILGYGSIGRQVARIAQIMGMDVIVYTAHPRDTPEQRRDHGYYVPGIGDPKGEVPSAWYSGEDRASIHYFLAQDLDQLLISVPLTSKTKGLLGKTEFDILAKKNAFVTNVARGEIVVQADLIQALKAYDTENPTPGEGLRGAALDVTTPEPLPKEDPLWEAPNCIITPHMSGHNAQYAERALTVLEENLTRLAKGDKLLNQINKEKGYASKLA